MIFIFLINFLRTKPPEKSNQTQTYLQHSEKVLNDELTCERDKIYESSSYLVYNTGICLINCTFQNIRSNPSSSALYILPNEMSTQKYIIANCTFRNCFANNGGAVFIYGQTNSLTDFSNCFFFQNSCMNNGGAVYVSKSNVTFSNCSFRENFAMLNGSTTSSSSCLGGSLFFDRSNGTLTNCDFYENGILNGVSTKSYGGAVFIIDSNRDFIDCTFYDCYVYNINNGNDISGGAVSVQTSTCNFDRCDFINNCIKTVGSESCEAGGGSLLVRETILYVNDCVFINNSVQSDKGDCFAGALFASLSEIRIERTKFDKNSVSSNDEYSNCIGGAIHIQNSTSLFILCNLTSNFLYAEGDDTVSNGGALHFISSEGNFLDCKFIGNSIHFSNKTRGGALFFSRAKGRITNSVINDNFIQCTKNKNENAGGGIAVFSSAISIADCDLKNNSIQVSNYVSIGYGGAIYFEGEGSILWCLFSYNKISSSLQSFGGAILLKSTGKEIRFDGCVFEYNTVEGFASCFSNGGSIFLSESTNSIFLECVFSNNLATTEFGECYGGAINARSGSSSFYNCDFHNNIAESTGALSVGGAISLLGNTDGICDSCVFNRNKSNSKINCFAGAIMVNQGIRNFTYCNFTENEGCADNECIGGVIVFLGSQKNNILNKCIFNFNEINSISTCYGVCVYSESSTLIFQYCDFNDNQGLVDSGNIFGTVFLFNENVEINECNFKNNRLSGTVSESTFKGGAIFSQECYVEITNTYFFNNSVYVNQLSYNGFGGAIYLAGTGLILHSCKFDSNFVESQSQYSCSGGSIFSYSSACIMYYVNFTGNYVKFTQTNSENCGAAIYSQVSEFNFFYCNFVENIINGQLNQGKQGGGILLSSSNGTFLRCLFEKNAAGICGAIALASGYGKFDYCSFINNNAVFAADIFYQNNNQVLNLEITNCNFVKDCNLNPNNIDLIYINYGTTSLISNVFINNTVTIFNGNQFVVFEGVIPNSAKNYWIFNKNCLYPYDQKFFTSQDFNMYDAVSNNIVTLDMAFDRYCIYQSSSFIFISHPFTYSQQFTYSSQFTKSQQFTYSSQFTNSHQFTYSSQFTNSHQFTYSSQFTKSSQFTYTSQFTKSNPFTKTQHFSKSNPFTKTQHFSKSSMFTESYYFTSSYAFTESQSLPTRITTIQPITRVPSSRFTKSSIFSPSKFFTKSDAFTKSDYFSKSRFFTKSNVFSISMRFSKSDFFTESNSLPPQSDITLITLPSFQHRSPSTLFTKSDAFSPSKFFTQSKIFTKSDDISSKYGDLASDFGTDSESSTLTETNSISSSESNSYNSESISNSFNETDLDNESNSFSFSFESISSSFLSKEISDTNDINHPVFSESLTENSISTSLSNLLFIPNTTPPKKKGSNKIMIIGIVCGIIAAILIATVIIILYMKNRNKNLNSSKENTTFIETKSNKNRSDISMNVDDDDRDLDFWL